MTFKNEISKVFLQSQIKLLTFDSMKYRLTESFKKRNKVKVVKMNNLNTFLNFFL